MGKITLDEITKKYIRKNVYGGGKSHLEGKNPNGSLPYCEPPISSNKIWTSDPAINGGINTNDELANALIEWYDEYGKIYQIDPNILVAQTFRESAFKVWNYPPNSTASGLGQFTDATFYDYVILDKRHQFTDEEKIKLTTGMIDYVYESGVVPPKEPFFVKLNKQINLLGRRNRATLHQNITNNPKLMIKAQFVLMEYLSVRSGNVASCAIFRYSRGLLIDKTTTSYPELITKASTIGTDYEDEGIKYVYLIFKILHDELNYKELDITNDGKAKFDNFGANLG